MLTPSLPATPHHFALTELALTEVRGPDSLTYLHGQLTCEVKSLQPGQHRVGGHCDAKGRLWSDVRLLCLPEALLLLTPASAFERQHNELKKFAVFAKVDITPSTLTAHGLAGDGSDALMLARWGLSESGLIDGGMALQVANDRWLLVGDPALLADLPVAAEPLWWGLDIAAGIGHITAACQGEYLPQMINLHALGGISFTKGCYLGQEPVARAKYRGANNRALYVLAGLYAGEVASGAELEIALASGWRRQGQVLNAWHADGWLWLTAVLPNDTAADAHFRLKDAEDSVLHVQPLPYRIDEA
ncbi:MAG: tRNA-modifying protein YgfZ [Aeromonas sp.]